MNDEKKEKVEATPEVQFGDLPLLHKVLGVLGYFVLDILGMAGNMLQYTYRTAFTTGVVALIVYPILSNAATRYGFMPVMPNALQLWAYLFGVGFVISLYNTR